MSALMSAQENGFISMEEFVKNFLSGGHFTITYVKDKPVIEEQDYISNLLKERRELRHDVEELKEKLMESKENARVLEDRLNEKSRREEGGGMYISPKPWEWFRANGINSYAVWDRDYKLVCGIPDENGANARLIAAAPDLLEACETLIKYREVVMMNVDGASILDMAEKAVKKVRGG